MKDKYINYDSMQETVVKSSYYREHIEQIKSKQDTNYSQIRSIVRGIRGEKSTPVVTSLLIIGKSAWTLDTACT